MKNCCILGLGYIGLPTAAVLANSGFRVNGVDINKTIVKDIRKGKIHIYEKGLEDLASKLSIICTHPSNLPLGNIVFKVISLILLDNL